MKRTTLLIALVALVGGIVAVAPPADAATISRSFTAAGDTYVYADPSGANSNFAAAPTLAISYDEFTQEQYALIQFDLSAIPPGTPIAEARLRLYVVSAPDALDVRIERINTAWITTGVTWTTRPTSQPLDPPVSRSVPAGGGTYVEWEIGTLVAEWRALRQPTPNFGIAVRGPAAYHLGVAFASAETITPPRLEVSYTPVVAIPLTVALEWTPGAADQLGDIAPGCPALADGLPPSYLANLERGFNEAARYLFSMSEGQVTLGAVTIDVGPAAWRTADVRILASSGYRPSAYVGGIVDAPRIAATPGGRPVLHYPAPVFLGRLWNGADARCGAWAEPEGWRTIGHELAHFGLFLFDQYVNVRDGAPQFCASGDLTFIADQASERAPAERGGLATTVMAYHYTADKLWRGDPPPATGGPRRLSCLDTPHDYYYPGQSEWDVLTHFYPSLRAPTGTARTDWDSVFTETIAAAGILQVETPALTALTSIAPVQTAAIDAVRPIGQAYLVRAVPGGLPGRIIGQGWRLPGEAQPPPFLGAVGDGTEQAAVYVADRNGVLRFAVPSGQPTGGLRTGVAAANSVSAVPTTWQPTLAITPVLTGDGSGLSELTALDVRISDCNAMTTAVDLVHCPAGDNCSNPVRVTRGDDDAFVQRFAPPAFYGYIYARSVDTGETYISWYQQGGGVGPAHINGHAPLVDGAVNVEAAEGGSAGDNRVLLYEAPVCSTAAQLAPGVAGLIGAPIGMQITVAENPQLQIATRSWGEPGQNDPPLRVRLGYSPTMLEALGIDVERLTVLRYDTPTGTWQLAGGVTRSNDLHWIAAAPSDFGGEGAIYALGYLEDRLFLPSLRR